MSSKRKKQEEKQELVLAVPVLESKVQVTAEGDELERTRLVPETPDQFTAWMQDQGRVHDAGGFRSREEFELFCMLPIPDSAKGGLLAKLRNEKRESGETTKRRELL